MPIVLGAVCVVAGWPAASRPLMSARMTRPPGPLPVTCDRSRWFSLASFRTSGDAIWRAAAAPVPLAVPFAAGEAAAARAWDAGERAAGAGAEAAGGVAGDAETAGATGVGCLRSDESLGAEAAETVGAGPPVPSSSRAIRAPISAFWPSGTRISARVPAW